MRRPKTRMERHHNKISNRRRNWILSIFVILALVVIGGTCYLTLIPSSNPNKVTRQITRPSHNQHPIKSLKHYNNQINNDSGNQASGLSDHNHNYKVGIPKARINQSNSHKNDTLAVFPQSIRGNWYSLDRFSNGGGKKVDKITITAHQIKETNCPTIYLHTRSKNAIPSKPTSRTQNWCDAVMGYDKYIPLVDVRSWSQTAGDGNEFGYLNVNGMEVLDLAGGADASTDANYFRSISAAKNHLNEQFHGEHYAGQK